MGEKRKKSTLDSTLTPYTCGWRTTRWPLLLHKVASIITTRLYLTLGRFWRYFSLSTTSSQIGTTVIGSGAGITRRRKGGQDVWERFEDINIILTRSELALRTNFL